MTPHLADTPVLRTPRLELRAPRPQDYPVWESFFLSDRAAPIRGGAEAVTGQAWRAFARIVGHWPLRGFGMFVLQRRDTGAAIGACGPWFPADWPEREVGWSIWDAAAEGQGYAAEAARAALAHVFGDLGWTTAVSYVATDNARSAALAGRLGAVRDGAAAAPWPDTAVFRHRAPAAAVARGEQP